MKTKEGMCPRCHEYTEVSWDNDGCCGAGAESEGIVWRYDDFEEPENDQLPALKALDQAIIEAKERKHFPDDV